MKLSVRHEQVGPPDSPHRLRIAHLSDFHLWFSDRKLTAIERLTTAWRPDVLALTGDYADTPTGRRLATEWIGRMAGVYPVCWVAGNHDRRCGAAFLLGLENVVRAHAIDRHDAWISSKSGRRFRFTSWERLHDAAAKPGEFEATVVLLHDPAWIKPDKLRGTTNRLLLAGHLHGGQITLWRDRLGRPQPAASCYRWLIDRTAIGAAELIVSRGLGDTLPIRFRAPREIVMVDFSV